MRTSKSKTMFPAMVFVTVRTWSKSTKLNDSGTHVDYSSWVT